MHSTLAPHTRRVRSISEWRAGGLIDFPFILSATKLIVSKIKVMKCYKTCYIFKKKILVSVFINFIGD